ncbi:DNA mismatch repair endonuclease MutL [Vibrio sp.]|uniref:DNA mismatch repair endonuclease MutL n=1 Tax=Vibrio sp. TaxID=678 RepID=UPI003D0C0F57
MSIKILPARLANQIAAGEVVERPASVVKELVENSLDAGATRIDVEIEKGGAKLIRIRDNGSGIDQEELGLALSRHATSKIHNLDDLEAIVSLGFRGEALASISSVSRLTLTSRTATQEQAWAAYAEGRDMQVQLSPAAHPVGTSVEVLDLFFNTPARRKFLRTEKTEFSHIDELLKRMALSRFDVTIQLKHNGKLVRQYRAANNEAQREKRIAAVCGAAFVRHMLKIELEHQGLKLHGWITTPDGARQQSDLQYCYVNGRMMRDKLINHAIRQSYETSLSPEQFASYILFIELDPHQVDVNVHPAKHEVRFHQARLVHDFIYQALADALSQTDAVDRAELKQSAFSEPSTPSSQDDAQPSNQFNSPAKQVPPRGASAVDNALQAIAAAPAYPRKQDSAANSDRSEAQVRDSAAEWQPRPSAGSGGGRTTGKGSLPSQQQVKAYSQLLKTVDTSVERASETPAEGVTVVAEPNENAQQRPTELGKAVQVVEQRYLLMAGKSSCQLVSLARAEWWRTRGRLNGDQAGLTPQPLLVPLAVKLSADAINQVEQYQSLWQQLGLEFKLRHGHSLMIMAVPQPLRQQNLQHLIPAMIELTLSWQDGQDVAARVAVVCDWLTSQITRVSEQYSLSEAIQLVAELEQVWQGQLPLNDLGFVQPVDFTASLAAFPAE